MYDIWNIRHVIADCLIDLNLNKLTSKVLDLSTPQELITKLIAIIETKAKQNQRHDVLERLYFSGLIYGTGR